MDADTDRDRDADADADTTRHRHTQIDPHRLTHTDIPTQTDPHGQTHTDKPTQTYPHRHTHTDIPMFQILIAPSSEPVNRKLPSTAMHDIASCSMCHMCMMM